MSASVLRLAAASRSRSRSTGDVDPSPATPTTVLGQRLVHQLKNLILAGELEPGARILQEELAARFGVSRIPVREALSVLASDGLVTIRPNSGCWVARLDLAECIEVYKIRERLEPLALVESIARIDDAGVARLERLVVLMEETRDLAAFLHLDRDFHVASYAAAAMPELLGLIERYWNQTQPYRRAFTTLVGEEGRVLIDYEHRLLIDGIARRDADGAASILLGHIRRTRLSLEANPQLFAAG